MATYSAGTASVDIKPDFRNFVKTLRADLERVKAELGVEIKPSTAGFSQELQRQLDGIRARLDVEISPDTSGFARDLETELSRVEATVGVDVEVDEASLERLERTLQARLAAMDLTATVQVDADTRIAAGEIATLREVAGRPVTVDVDADTSAAAAEIAALRASTVTIGVGASGGGGRGMSRGLITGAANLGALGIANLPAMATGLATIGADLQAITQSAALLPGIFTGAAAAIGTLVVGFEGMKDAFSDSPKKVEEAMSKMADSAKEVVNTIRGFGDEWTRVRTAVQGTLFEGVAEPLGKMIDAQLPVVERGMVGIAGKYSEGFKVALGELGSERSTDALGQIFRNTENSAGRLNGAILPIMNSIRTLATTGSNFLPQLAQGFTNAATKFDAFITKANQSGDLARWMKEGIDAVKTFGSIIGNLGSSLSSIFRAVKGDGDGFLVTVDKLTERMATFLKSDVGQANLREFFMQGREQMEQWEPILQNIGTFLKSVYEASQTWAGVLMPFLQAASSLLAGNETAVQSLLVAWLAYRTIGPILTGLVAQIGAFRVASAAAATAGAGALGRSVAGLGAVLGGAGPLGLGLAAAAIGLGFLATKHNEAKQAAEEQQRALEALGETLDKQSGKVTEATIAQAAGTLEEEGFLERAESFGVNTQDYVRASLGLDQEAKDRINEQLTTTIVEESGSAGTRFRDVQLHTGLSDVDIAQALQGVPEAVQRYSDAVATAQQTIDAGGGETRLADLAELKNAFNDVGESAATLGGQMNGYDTAVAEMGESTRRTNEAINGTHQLTEQGAAAFEALGLAVESVPDAKTVFVDSTTEEEQRKLEELGYTVTHMEDGTVKITLNDEQARAQIQELVKPETKTVTVTLEEAAAALGPYAKLYPPLAAEGYADGGVITGGIPGRDSVPILGMPGEVVFDRGAVAALGGPAAADRFRVALGAGLVRGYAEGGVIHPQAALPGRMTDEEIERLNAQARVDQANTDRNRVYADMNATQEQRSAADREYASAQNALEKQNTASGSTGDDGSLPSQYSAQGIGARAGAIIGQGILSFFGLENSVLSDSNVYNKAFHDVQEYYAGKDKEKAQESTTGEGYGYQPQNLATDQTDTAAAAEREAKKADKGSGTGGSDVEYAAGAGVEQWRGTFLGVLGSLGMPASWVGLGLQQMQSESGGNPQAINNWDINAQNGTPSKGLMQVIDPTFQSYRSPMYPNDVWDPGANIAAALQYLVARYGGPEGVWGQGHGYADGGWAFGPGGSRSDGIKARLSNGEFVVNAAAAALNAPLLEAINGGTLAGLPELPAGLTPRGGDTNTSNSRDHSVNFNGDMHLMNVDHLMKEQDRWATNQAMGALAVYG